MQAGRIRIHFVHGRTDVPRSHRNSASRVLVAALALILICGALLILPKRSNERLTASITPIGRQQTELPPTEPADEPRAAIDPVQEEDGPNQIEVPRPQTLPKNVRVAMLQPTTQISPPPVPVIDNDFFDEFEANLVPSPDDDEEEMPLTDIDIAQSQAIPLPRPDLEPEPEPESKPDPESQPVAPTPTVVRQVIDTSGIESALADIRTEMSRITELRLKQARAEHMDRINRLERQIDQLRTAQANPRPVKVQVDLHRGGSVEPDPDRLEVYEPIEIRQQTNATHQPPKAEVPGELELPETPAPPLNAEAPMTVADPVIEQRHRIEYPPADMENVEKTTKAPESVPATAPRYQFITPQNAGPILEPLAIPGSQPYRSPQCTRSSPRVSLLSRLRSRRPTPCRHCGRVH